MLITTSQMNDWYFFLERDELQKLKKETLEGMRIHKGEIIGKLELNVDIAFCREKKGRTVFDYSEPVKVTLRDDDYQRIVERGTIELHEGFRHLNFLDINRLSVQHQFLYGELQAVIEREK